MAVKEAARKSERDTNRALSDYYNGRLVERIFSEAAPAFVLKGGRGMLARNVRARYTRDTDFAFHGEGIEEAVSEIKRIARIDLGDYIEFRFVSAVSIAQDQEYREGCRVVFDIVFGGAKRMGEASLDLVVEEVAQEDADRVSPENRLEIEGLPVFDYLVYPVASAVADKACATMQKYSGGRSSSRVRDLVDIVVYLTTETMSGVELERRIDTQSGIRRIAPLEQFFVPELWHTASFKKAFSKLAEEAGLPDDLRDLASSEAFAKACLDPAIGHEVSKRIWSPESRSWL